MGVSSDGCKTEGCWISFIMRLSIASLFGTAAVAKFLVGRVKTVTYFQTAFQNTWLPQSLVTIEATIIPFLETAICIWLLVGYKLKMAWVFASLVTITLAFGMAVVSGYGVAGDNYFYVLLCCVGLYFSKYDRWSVDGMRNK